MALAAYKMLGKKGYLCVRFIFKGLPSIQSLQEAQSKLKVSPGLNPIIREHLRSLGKKLDKKEKCCVLMFDEVPYTNPIQMH